MTEGAVTWLRLPLFVVFFSLKVLAFLQFLAHIYGGSHFGYHYFFRASLKFSQYFQAKENHKYADSNVSVQCLHADITEYVYKPRIHPLLNFWYLSHFCNFFSLCFSTFKTSCNKVSTSSPAISTKFEMCG